MLPMNSQSSRASKVAATRRRLIGTAATTGGLAGCLDSNAKTGQEVNTADPAQRSGPEHDHSGDYLGESQPVERIDVNRLDGSTRFGDTVYYDPDERGPYADLTAAIADVPRGGTLQLGHGVYDVAEEGRLVIDHEMNVRGVGWTRLNRWNHRTDGQNTFGTVIKNVKNPKDSIGQSREWREPAIQAPAVEINVDSHEGNGRHVVLRDLAVRSPTPETPIVLVSNTIRTLIADCLIHGGIQQRASAGIQYIGSSFFAHAYRNVINGTGNYGIQVLGGGYGYAFHDNHVRCEGNDDGDAVALETTRHRTIVQGGEYTGQIGLRFRAPSSKQLGGYVVEPGFESNDVAIDIGGGGGAPFENVQIYHTKLSMAEDHVAKGVRFGNTTGSKYIYPIVWQRGEKRPLVEWTGQSRNCGVIADPNTLGKVTYSDDGATSPYVHVRGSATRDDLSEIPTGVPTSLDYLEGEGAPATHDGTAWRTPDMSAID
jgi:hypothetical protein